MKSGEVPPSLTSSPAPGPPWWPSARAADALRALARASGLTLRGGVPAALPGAPRPGGAPAAFARFVEDAAAFLGFEAEPLAIRYGDVDGALARGGPGVLVLEGTAGAEPRLLAWRGTRRGRLRVVGPDGPASIPLEEVRRLLRAPSESEVSGEMEALLAGARLPSGSPRRSERLRRALLGDRLADRTVARGFTLAEAPSAPFAKGARGIRLVSRLGALLGLHTAQYLLGLGAWVVVGRGALAGRLDARSIGAFLVLRLAVIPLQVLTTWMSGTLAADGGALLKRRLLFGALGLDPEEVRHRGVGRFLGLVYESSAVEKMGLGGGFAAVLALVELAVSTVVLALGAGGVLHAASLLLWTALAVGLGLGYLRRRQDWTDRRLGLTYDLVERLGGHRTRLAQEDPARHHDEEDRALADYVGRSRALDRAQIALGAVVPWGWLVVGTAGLLVAYVYASAGDPGEAGRLATGLGGVVLAQRALARLTDGLTQVVGAVIAWREVRPLFAAAARPPLVGAPRRDDEGDVAGAPVVEARDLTFRYGDHAAPVLRGASLAIRAGERILVHGASGGGKSTLASLLAGLRTPEAGSLLAGGLDRATLGANGWRRRVVSAPQFHDNHVFSATFAFNLLLGRRWPPERADLQEAEALCRELGLGPLIERMPAGILQMVGETGWQLSHGERSRLYIARALLQGSDLLILDESFAALDPTTLERAMACVLARARALMIIAHP